MLNRIRVNVVFCLTNGFFSGRYDPLNKFMLLKQCDWPSGNLQYYGVNSNVFEMIITPELEYPIVCVNVRRGPNESLKLDLINTNNSECCANDELGLFLNICCSLDSFQLVQFQCGRDGRDGNGY